MKTIAKTMTHHNHLSILIVDDELAICEGLEQFLTPCGFRVRITNKSMEALQLFKNQLFDIVILDLIMPELDGISLLKEIRRISPETEVIIISGYGEIQNVIEAMRLGAVDFFQKPFKLPDIQRAIENTMRYHELRTQLQEVNVKYRHLSEELRLHYGKPIIGQSDSMKKIIHLMAKVAAADITSVIISGESGTGKELIARGIHLMSIRKDRLFLAVNCSSVSETLFESEFFGHTKGSFTGAIDNKEGYFEAANKGTIFLDEIGDLHLNHQAKVLRALEERKVTRVGSFKEIEFDVRIIAATNHDIVKLMAESKFREDLYHRINSFVIDIPPLRERREDIPLLLEFFIRDLSGKLNKKVNGFEKSLLELLSGYHYPGNIRELRNMVERAIILCDGSLLKPNHFPILSKEPQETMMGITEFSNTLDLAENEKTLIIQALQKTGNNKNLAARMLNITWQSLDRKMKKHRISFYQAF